MRLNIFLFFFSLNVFGAESNQLQIYVDQYFFFKNQKKAEHEVCKEHIADCVNSTCQQLGNTGCDEKSEMDEVLQWCRGNYDGRCVNTSCWHLGTFGCDERHEVQAITRACVGNFGGDCVDTVCKRLGGRACDELDEVIEVAKKCAGN